MCERIILQEPFPLSFVSLWLLHVASADFMTLVGVSHAKLVVSCHMVWMTRWVSLPTADNSFPFFLAFFSSVVLTRAAGGRWRELPRQRRRIVAVASGTWPCPHVPSPGTASESRSPGGLCALHHQGIDPFICVLHLRAYFAAFVTNPPNCSHRV